MTHCQGSSQMCWSSWSWRSTFLLVFCPTNTRILHVETSSSKWTANCSSKKVDFSSNKYGIHWPSANCRWFNCSELSSEEKARSFNWTSLVVDRRRETKNQQQNAIVVLRRVDDIEPVKATVIEQPCWTASGNSGKTALGDVFIRPSRRSFTSSIVRSCHAPSSTNHPSPSHLRAPVTS